jgi:hypothetical protein
MDLPIPTTAKAKLVSLGSDQRTVAVHFNPTSLVYTIENSTPAQSGSPTRKQFAAQFSGKLSMDLQFDTTDTGADVRQTTRQVAAFMHSSAQDGKNPSSGNPQAQPVVSFQWGAYEFQGTLDSFKETIDFFSADGVPLRSVVSISMSRQDLVLDAAADSQTPNTASAVPTAAGQSATSVATQGGDPSAARRLGTDNGLENLRATGGATLQVGGGIQLKAAAGFSASASAGASAGLSIGGGASISGRAGLGAGATGGASFGATAGVVSASSLQLSAGARGGALFGGAASAGVPATAGAFAGLETGRATVSTTTRLDPLRLLRATTSAGVSTGANASFALGGAAAGRSGFSANVGASFNFADVLVFDAD